MNSNPRIKLDMTGQQILVVMCDGNPGGLNVMLQLAERTESIDLDAAFGPWHYILSLDALRIYGSDIWILYKDLCGESLEKMVAVLRGWQLGIVPEEHIRSNIHEVRELHQSTLDVDDILAKVKERLPNFGGDSDGE